MRRRKRRWRGDRAAGRRHRFRLSDGEAAGESKDRGRQSELMQHGILLVVERNDLRRSQTPVLDLGSSREAMLNAAIAVNIS
jgi:hypothetical protein